jgi:hypothetical protein
MTIAAIPDLREELSTSERELLSELLQALRTIRYGSVVLTVHDGRIVEIQKTERIRRNAKSEDSAGHREHNPEMGARIRAISTVREDKVRNGF